MPGKFIKKLLKKGTKGATKGASKVVKNKNVNTSAFKGGTKIDNVDVSNLNVNKKLPKWLNEMVYNIKDKGTIRDMRWKATNPEGYHYNMIRKGKPFSGKQHGGPVFNSKGMRVPVMVQDGGSTGNNEVSNKQKRISERMADPNVKNFIFRRNMNRMRRMKDKGTWVDRGSVDNFTGPVRPY